MAEHDTLCLICGHYDHFIKLSSLSLFDNMCWTGTMWNTDCKCLKHISTNLEYLEYRYDKKNKKSEKF